MPTHRNKFGERVSFSKANIYTPKQKSQKPTYEQLYQLAKLGYTFVPYTAEEAQKLIEKSKNDGKF